MKNYVYFFFFATLAVLSEGSTWGPKSSVLVNEKQHAEKVSLQISGGASKKKSKAVEAPKKMVFPTDSIAKMSTIWAFTVFTFHINNKSKLGGGPVRACSVAALIGTLLLPSSLAVLAMAGAIAGMAKMAVIPSTEASLALGVVMILVMNTFDSNKWLVGVGGRLGVAAQFACTIQFIVAGLLGNEAGEKAALIGDYPPVGELIEEIPTLGLYATLGAFIMRLWKGTLSKKGGKAAAKFATPVAAVGATGLVASYTLPASAVPPTFMGSLVAMSAPGKIPTPTALVLACFLAAVCQQMLAGVLLGGWSGKLGVAAAMGVLAYVFLAQILGLTS